MSDIIDPMLNLDIAELIPHSGAMILLDRVVAYDAHGLEAELVVRGGNPVYGDTEHVPAWVGIEYMAQTVAAYAGVLAKAAHAPIQLGFLLGTRRFTSNVPNFKVGTVLNVKVIKIIQDENLGVFECQILADGISVTANLNVYQPPL